LNPTGKKEDFEMKLFRLDDRIETGCGETVLGAKDLDTHACYLIYGKLEIGGDPVVLKPGTGHEEIICVVGGKLEVDDGTSVWSVTEGQAFYLVGEEKMLAKAVSETAVYVIAGGHSAGSGHSH
jgi:hypothetical protein